MERVVITGMGICSPLGSSPTAFWENLIAGRSGAARLQEPDLIESGVLIGARSNGFDPLDYISRKETRRLSLASQLAIGAAEQAIEQADLDSSPDINLAEVGVLIGSSIGGFASSDPHFANYHLKKRSSPLVIPLSMNYGPSASVSIRRKYQGPVLTVDAACATAAHSIGYAYNLIRTGMLKIAITGGADNPFSPAIIAAWNIMRALSRRSDQPETACRPFSHDRDGLVLGDGAGIVVLEAESSARRRGATILAELSGYGASADSHHITQPDHRGMALAMQRSLQDANLQAGDIGYINAHGTGTEYNDFTETAAIKEVFADRAHSIPVVSTKAALGHSIGASGGLELIACVMTLSEGLIPPTINYTGPDPRCDLDYVTAGSRKADVQHAISNSFAFGGSNAVVTISRYQA